MGISGVFADNALVDAVRRSFGTGGFTHNSTKDGQCTFARLDRWYCPMDDGDIGGGADDREVEEGSTIQYDAKVQSPVEKGKSLVWPSDHMPVYILTRRRDGTGPAAVASG